METKKDIRKRILYVVLGLLIVLLARNSVELAGTVRFMLHPYSRTPVELYELEEWVQCGNYQELIKAIHKNAALEEMPVSDTSEYEALAGYIEAAFDYHVMKENGKIQEASVYWNRMQEELEGIEGYRFQEVIRAVQELYE